MNCRSINLDILVLDKTEIADPGMIQTVRTSTQIGQRHFQAY